MALASRFAVVLAMVAAGTRVTAAPTTGAATPMFRVDGKPRLVLGLYENPADDARLRQAVEAGFNLFNCAPTQEALDRVRAAGAYGWVNVGMDLDLSHNAAQRKSVLTGMAGKLSSHPGLLVWEAPDEALWNCWYGDIQTLDLELAAMYEAAGADEGLHQDVNRAADLASRALWTEFEQVRAAVWKAVGKPSPHPAMRLDLAPKRVATMAAGFASGIAALRKADPHHPIWLNHAPRNSVASLRLFNRTADAAGCDIYPVPPNFKVGHSDLPNTSLSSVGAFTDRMRAGAPGKICAMVLQGFGWADIQEGVTEKQTSVGIGRRPTFEETRFMAYDALLHGAGALLYWGSAYLKPAKDDVEGVSQLWLDIMKVAREIRALEPAWLAPANTAKWSVKAEPGPGSYDGGGVIGTLRQVGGDWVLVVANETPHGMAFKIANLPPALEGRTLYRLGADEVTRVAHGGLRDGMRSGQVHVYSTTRRFEVGH